MRNIKFSIIAAAMILGSTLTSKAQTADDIIQKHIAAIGGADNWKKITSIKTVGSVTAQGMEIPMTITVLNGKAAKMEFTINGMTCYEMMTTTEGWGYFPIQGQTKPEAMPADVVKQEQDGLDVGGGLIDYKSKGNTVTYLGKDEVEGTECHKLKVVYPSGKEETMYIDASNYYHIRSVEKVKAGGKEQEQTSNYGNFQKLPEGIVYPMSSDQGMGTMIVKTVEINKPIDESIFKPTADAGKPGETKK